MSFGYTGRLGILYYLYKLLKLQLFIMKLDAKPASFMQRFVMVAGTTHS
jgi:hypothetical protein